MINIHDYSAKIRDYIKRKGFSCVYLVSCDGGRPTKIGIASDIYYRLNGLQVGNWIKLDLQYILWTQGSPVSTRVEAELHKNYGKYTIGCGWFDCHYTDIQCDVERVAKIFYPSLVPISHDGMIERARKSIDGRYDRELTKFGLSK